MSDDVNAPLEKDPENPNPVVEGDTPDTTTETAAPEGEIPEGSEQMEAAADDQTLGVGASDETGVQTANEPNGPATVVPTTEAGVQADANKLTPPPIAVPDNSSPDGASDAPTHVNEGLTTNDEGEGDIDTLWATEKSRVERNEALAAGAADAGVAYPLGTDPKTVNVIPEKSKANPDIVVIERGKPISHTENRSLRDEQVDRTRQDGPGPQIVRKRDANGAEIDNDGKIVADGDSYQGGYTPQPQTPDPLVTIGHQVPSSFIPTTPVGSTPQPGAPVVDSNYVEDDEDDEEIQTDADAEPEESKLDESLTVGSGDENSAVSWPAEHRGISGLRTLAPRAYLASSPNPNATETRDINTREAIPQTAVGGAVR
jgi:hypothetical protein